MSNQQLDEVQQINEQIKKLKERVELLLLEGRSAAIEQIKSMMVAYKIDSNDLGLTLKPPPRVRPMKYRDPDSGREWSGQGIAPKWIEGKNREDYLVVKIPAAS